MKPTSHTMKHARILAALILAPALALSACDTLAGPGPADSGAISAGGSWPYASLGRAKPIVIGHRGASGHVPEHTLESYQRALNDGADCIEPDLVMTKDNVLVARHDLYLSTTTNVGSKPEFATRKRKTDDAAYEGRNDWWVEDFTLAEIKSLRAVQPFEGRTKVFDGLYQIPTFDEVLMLAKSRVTVASSASAACRRVASVETARTFFNTARASVAWAGQTPAAICVAACAASTGASPPSSNGSTNASAA